MKVAAITAERAAALVDVADPTPFDDFALVRVEVTPICTEFKAYANGWKSTCLGHEAAGTIIAVGPNCARKVGERVVAMPLSACLDCRVCRQGDYIHCELPIDVHAASGNEAGTATYAPLLIKRGSLLLPIPDDLTTEQGAMACCGLGPTFGALNRMGVVSGETLLIAGLGPVGLGGVINGLIRTTKVFALESHPYRRELALALGAVEVFDPRDPDVVKQVRAATGGGPDAAIDCTGVAAAQRNLIDAVRRRGQVAFIGEGGELTVHTSNDLLRKGLTLHGVWHWNLHLADAMFETIRRARPLIDQLITHRFPMSRVQEAWELQLTGNCGKILLDPQA